MPRYLRQEAAIAKNTARDRRPRSDSVSDPLRIAEVVVQPGFGKIGITICPGKIDRTSFSTIWNRDLDLDLDAIRDWGAAAVVTLIENHEFRLLHVPGLRQGVLNRGMVWRHFPIRDVSIPNKKWERHWQDQGGMLVDILRSGRNVLVHCRGGLGRAGMVACQLLTDLGVDAEDSLDRVRAVRPGAVETVEQEDWVLGG